MLLVLLKNKKLVNSKDAQAAQKKKGAEAEDELLQSLGLFNETARGVQIEREIKERELSGKYVKSNQGIRRQREGGGCPATTYSG